MYTIEKLKYKNILKIDNLQIAKNKVTFISGPSGSGKSTLLNILVGNIYNYEGSVKFYDNELKSYSVDKLRSHVGYLSQNIEFYTPTISEEFKYIAKLLNIKVTDEKINKVLNLAALESENQEIAKLSGGEKQRLALARLIFSNKTVLLLDEITSALDEEKAEVVMENIITYAKENGITIISVTHDKKIIDKFSEEVILIGGHDNGN